MGNSYGFSEIPWLSEPTRIDNTWAKYDESLLSWLERSTLPRAQSYRQFLRNNLTEIPSIYREYFIRSLQDRWDSAFLEFVIARTVQILGGKFLLEQKNISGKHPDFLVDFGDSQLVIEVVSPSFDREGLEERVNDAPLLEFINENAPHNWSLDIIGLPDIGPEDSKKEFKSAFHQICSSLPVKPEEKWYYANKDTKFGELALRFFPKKLGYEPIISGKMYPFGNAKDVKEKIVKSVKKKRKQVRSESLPVLLAVHGSGYGVTFNNFDCALFGQAVTEREGINHTRKPRFEKSGIFLRSGTKEKSPTFAGVLAFKRIDLHRRSDPVFYQHPKFTGKMPTQLEGFEKRIFRNPDEIIIRPAKCPGILSQLDLK
jgi:hypothetical protein